MPKRTLTLKGKRLRIGVAADHGGFELKERLAVLLRGDGYEVIDFGDGPPSPDDDYPKKCQKELRT